MQRLPVTHGKPTHLLTVRGFALTRATYSPEMAVTRHQHEHPSWTYVTRGGFEESFDRAVIAGCTEGTLLSKPAHAAHANRYGTHGASCLLIEIAGTELLTAAEQSLIFRRITSFATGKVPAAARRILRELAVADQATALGVTSLLLEIAALIARDGAREHGWVTPPWLRRVHERLIEEFREPPSLEALAVEAHVHPTYLCQAFRRAYRTSPGECVRQARACWALQALVSTELSLAAIAVRAGYSDQSHFSRQFRSHFGETPARYRLRHRRGA